MKKTNLCLSILSLLAIGLVGIKVTMPTTIQTQTNQTVDSIEETPLDLLSKNLEAKELSEAETPLPVEKSELYTQFGFNETERLYYLRFAIAYKGDVNKIVFHREVTIDGETASKDFNVETVYAGISSNGEVLYYSDEGLTNDQAKKGDYYWACYTIKYQTNDLALSDVKVDVIFNDDEENKVTRSESLKDVILLDNQNILNNEYLRFEAEDFADEALISSSETASNGKYLGFTDKGLGANEVINFNFGKLDNQEYSLSLAASYNGASANQTAEGFDISLNNEKINTLTVNNYGSYDSYFYEYPVGHVTLDSESTINITSKGNATLDYLALNSYLSIDNNQSNTFIVYTFDTMASKLSINSTADTVSTCNILINNDEYRSLEVNAGANLSKEAGLITLKPGKNIINIASEATINQISLTSVQTMGRFEDSALTIEAEKSIYQGRTEVKEAMHGGICVSPNKPSYNGYAFSLSTVKPLMLSLFYGSYNKNSDCVALYVNNQFVDNIDFDGMNNWNNPDIKTLHIASSYLQEGINTISLFWLKEGNYDALMINSALYEGNSMTIEAETADVVNGRLTSNCLQVESISGDLQYTFESNFVGKVNLEIAYAAWNALEDAFGVIVNDVNYGSIDIQGFSNWTSYNGRIELEIDLSQGTNTLIIQRIGGNYNLDWLKLSPLN